MNTKSCSLLLALAFVAAVAVAAPTKTYQVTGPVLEVTDSMIAVQKGKERWEIARDAATSSDAAIKVGDKVTVTYTMTATKVEIKADKQAQAEGKISSSPTAPPPKK